MNITGSEAIVKCLEAEGIPVVFGYPGATIVPFYDSLSRSKHIRHILTRSEQGAGHAANGWARMYNKPGVCIATSGPGATNLFTSIATAYSDSIPLIAITGQVATHKLGHDIFQEVDTTGAVEPFTKYAYLIKSPEELGQVFREAFHIASTGRKGPVLIDVPVDIQEQTVNFSYPETVCIRGYKPALDGHPLQVRRVADAISVAEKPLICCGGGVFLSGAQGIVRTLCEDAGIPAVYTMMGIGVLPPDHPLSFGMVGQTGTETANTAVQESDLLILIGARVGDRAITHPANLESHTTIVHIDIDTAEIGKNMGTTIPLVGDALRVVSQLLERKPRSNCHGWLDRLNRLRTQGDNTPRPQPDRTGVDPAEFVRRLCSALPDGSIYVSDVGQNQIWSARGYNANGRFLTTGGMGTMGYGLPAAIGAKLAEPDKTVVCVCGDGAFQMSMNELATVCQHNVPLKMVVMQNHTLGLVRDIQQRRPGGREFAVDLTGGPDIEAIAAAYGIRHGRLCEISRCDAAINKMLCDNEPYLLVCDIDPKEES